MDGQTSLGGLALPSPVLTASGCGGSGRELAPYTDLARLGAFITPSLTPQPRAGRPTPRLAETPSGLLTATGLPGPGVDGFLQRDLPWLAEQGARVIASVAGGSVGEFATVARRLRGAELAALEINVACPNAEDRGQMFAGHPDAAAAVVRAVRAAVGPAVPVFAKLSPDVTDIVTIALACVDAGATGLSLINTVTGMAIDPVTLRPAVSGIAGGLSGPAIRPIAIRCVHQVHAALPDTPLIGGGGIATGPDALEFLLAGATAVAVGSTLLHDPGAASRIQRELEDALSAAGLSSAADAVGLSHRAPGQPGSAPRQRIRPAQVSPPLSAVRPAAAPADPTVNVPASTLPTYAAADPASADPAADPEAGPTTVPLDSPAAAPASPGGLLRRTRSSQESRR
jgi:dihydroorotate dehydrogenase (NAD+) catalytic subunit